MKYFFSLLAVFVLSAAVAQAQPDPASDPNAMRHCQSFDECTLVWSGCNDDAINKKFIGQYKQTPACLASMAHNPKALPTCANGLCVVVVPDEKK